MPLPGRAFLQRERLRVRRWLGADLPPRTLDARLPPPPPLRGSKPPPGNPAKLKARLLQHRATPTDYLETLLATARALNRTALAPRRRFRTAEELARWFYAEAAPHWRELASTGGGIPELPERAARLTLYLQISQALIDAYLAVFLADYARQPFWYARVRPRVYRCTTRLLDLIRFEQRLTALRYARLRPQSWRIANTVYALMRACENVEIAFETLAAAAATPGERRLASLDDLYAAIHCFHILDHCAWPELAQPFIDTYCNAIAQAVRFHPHDARALTAARDTLFVACYQDGPPDRTLPSAASADALGPALIIDYRILADSIRLDYVELSRARGDRNRFAMPPRLAVLAPVHQTANGYLLYRNLRLPGQWEDVASGRARHRDLRVYVGFDEVRAHLQSIFATDDQRLRGRELSNLFARRSAIIGEDDSATEQSLWYVLYQSQELMRVKTQETRFTHRMFIGNLLAYGFGEQEVFQPRIGKVNRLFRPEPGHVIIDIEYLASYASPVMLHKRDPSARGEDGRIKVIGQPQAALLIHHPSRGWGIITPPQERFWEFTAVGIQSGRGVRLGELGEAQDATAEFYWFGLLAEGFPRSAPGYPGQARASADASPA